MHCSAGVQVWWWDPFGAAVFALAGGPALLFDGAVVGAAGQGERGDVGVAVGGPAVEVMDLSPVTGVGRYRADAERDGLPT